MYCRYLLMVAGLCRLIAAYTLCKTATTSPCTPPTGPPTCTSSAPARQTSPCVGDVHIIVNRATTECEGPGTSDCVAEAVAAQFKDADVDYNPYPATDGGTNISAKAYVASEDTGVSTLRDMITDYQSRCNNTKIALIGYSQGAQVVADVLYGNTEADPWWYTPRFKFTASPPIDRDTIGRNIAAVTLFGDPSFVPGMPGNCGTSLNQGSWFKRGNTSASSDYAGILRSYCDANDSFCDCGEEDALRLSCVEGANSRSRLATHTGYIYCNVYTDDAVDFMVAAIHNGAPPACPVSAVREAKVDLK